MLCLSTIINKPAGLKKKQNYKKNIQEMTSTPITVVRRETILHYPLGRNTHQQLTQQKGKGEAGERNRKGIEKKREKLERREVREREEGGRAEEKHRAQGEVPQEHKKIRDPGDPHRDRRHGL